MTRFAYSTNAYTRFPLARAIQSIRALGYDGIELLVDTPHLVPPVHLGLLRTVIEQLEGCGLEISNLNVNTSRVLYAGPDPSDPGPTLVSADVGKRQARLGHILASVELAMEIDASPLSITSGPPDHRDGGRGREYFIHAIRQILRMAEWDGTRIGIEYEPGFLVGDLASLVSVLDEVDHPLLGANLDLGHARVVGDDPAEAIRALKGRIWNMHIEDIRGRVHRHLVPGEGDMDFHAIRKAIEETGYDGFLTVELYTCADDPEGAGRRALAYLKEVFG